MKKLNSEIDLYLQNGCGRCELGGTPECKVHLWPKELIELRKIAIDSGLTEERKWGVPCYTYEKKNILIIAAFKENCRISFFKGVLLKDPENILSSAGENSQSAKFISFTNVKDIVRLKSNIKSFIEQAIEIEKSGAKVEFKKISEHKIPEEFQKVLDDNPKVKTAFESLTPGRQRGYLIHFSAPKQSSTRQSRIDKCIPQILKGKGMND